MTHLRSEDSEAHVHEEVGRELGVEGTHVVRDNDQSHADLQQEEFRQPQQPSCSFLPVIYFP